jgi:ATP-dependent DNA helicase RecG
MVSSADPVQLPSGDHRVRVVTISQNPPLTPLQQPITELWGVGRERASQLDRLGIKTVGDLLLHRPRRYEDRRRFCPIRELALGQAATSRGTIVACGTKWFRNRTKSVFEIIVDDGTGRLHCRWWNLPFMERYFSREQEVVVYGKLLGFKPRTMDHPEAEVIETGEENLLHFDRIVPVYPLTEGLPQRWLRSLVARTLERYGAQVVEPFPESVIPEVARCLSRAQALNRLHFPDSIEQAEQARQRLALDEFVEFQLRLQQRRKNFEFKARSRPLKTDNRLVRPFLSALPFKLTSAQTSVLREIRGAMSGAHPMRRLLQGDVGSGKTVVAACAALMTIESGSNVAVMAPTEILAEQHATTFTRWFHPLGIRVVVQTGARKTEMPEGAGRGGPTLFIGTHALIQPGFLPANLGLVIIDEQHRFGVAQREALLRKGEYPHLLVMTATPIPRTLALTLYGELDVSAMTQSPGGRGRLKTFVRGAETLPKVWEFAHGKLAEGRQLYVVYPRVEDKGQQGMKAVKGEFENVQRLLAPFRVGLLHGKVKPGEKQEIMDAFRANRIQALVATSLIEVGVDVPNATVMLIENADQFGLAQLHQLRGRIGRGSHDSYCVLIAAADSPDALERLRVLQETSDGLKIAERDLELRGPGDFLGHQQSGVPEFKFGDLARDLGLLEHARQIAGALLAEKEANT